MNIDHFNSKLYFTSRVLCFLTVFILLSYGNETYGRKIRTTHKIEKNSKGKTGEKTKTADKLESGSKHGKTQCEAIECPDSVAFDKSSVSFSGYDKPVSSSKESFLVTNNNSKAIEALEIKITYLDMKDRMLHSRIVNVSCYVPAGETRKADISSWDTQKTYYYYLGPSPKRVATPYKVKITPVRILFACHDGENESISLQHSLPAD